MSFEKSLSLDINKLEFDKDRYLKTFKEREHISRLVMDSDAGCTYLKVGDSAVGKYSELEPAYVGILGLVFDVVISVYNPNDTDAALLRFYKFDDAKAKWLEDKLDHMLREGDNLEVRIVGMQTGQERLQLLKLARLLEKRKMKLYEIDLFGNETRNIVFDKKRGIFFNVLVDNKPYKPGDLTNTLTVEQFERANHIEVVAEPVKEAKPKKKGKK